MRQRKTVWSAFFVSMTIALGLLGGQLLGVMQPFSSFAHSTLELFPRSAYLLHIRIRDVWTSLTTNQEAELKELRSRVTQLESELAAFSLIQEENELLRSQLGVTYPASSELILARVIGEEPNSFSRFLLIGAGRRDGITLNQPVLFNSALVGYIAEVDERASKVMLVTDPKSTLYANVGAEKAEGLVKGSLGLGHLTMTEIPRDALVSPGDFVYTTGQTDPHVSDILIGTVKEIHTEDRDTFQTVTVEPAVDLRSLELVFVMQE